MNFRNQNILIACSDKRDRLQLFNYFDFGDAEKIYTASDCQQMNEILQQHDETFAVLVIEISPQWLQSRQHLEEIQQTHIGMSVVALIPAAVSIGDKLYHEYKQQVDDMLFSPFGLNELKSKRVGLSQYRKYRSQHVNPIEEYLEGHFQATSQPKALIDVSTHHFSHVNDAMEQQFKASQLKLFADPWYNHATMFSKQQVRVLHLAINEQGHANASMVMEWGDERRPINVDLFYLNIGGHPYYLAEFADQTHQIFQDHLFKSLGRISRLDFGQDSAVTAMHEMITWAGMNFCFIVKRDRSGEYGEVVWDCSKDEYAKQFSTTKHEFVLRKLENKDEFLLPAKAWVSIPGDDFLRFYQVESFMAFNCYVDAQHDAIMVAGSLSPINKWASLKLLFSQLASYFKQSMAFKVLQRSHETESQYDVLTNLMNRRYITRKIESSLERSTKNNDFLAVMFLDLDRFKVINDSLGHDVGDEVLVNIANLLKHHVNGYGVAARYAGDEFLILMDEQVAPEVVQHIAQDILASVAHPIKLKNGSEINLTISLGLAFFPDHGTTVDTLIKHADVALYDAKLNGKNRYTVYDSNLDGDQAKQSEEMLKNLQQAIDGDQIDVFYQPKINAKSEDVMGFEALVRWEHPELGLISPGLFIPLAEQSELIHHIGLLVIKKACMVLKQWHKSYNLPLTMSINLSPIQLSDKNLISKINTIIEETGVHPKHLDFEITESEKFKSVKDALLMFKKLVALGCTLSIDDFGTGHSTLDYLRRIPAKTLKIDQVFVRNIGLSPDDEAILDATIDMAKRVGHFIVAEGVETEEQRQYLTNKGCDFFQGYLFCRPVPAEEIEQILYERAQILKNN